MPLPRFLIIGAMKAGTTSLYMDLAGHRQVFMAGDKEPNALCSDAVLTPTGLAQYEAIYAKAGHEQLCCDASTNYSKRPDFEGVAERAVRTLPAGFQVIYLVRHPIERIISQHHHEHFVGLAGPSIDDEVRRHPRYIQYSRYNYQLEPWIDAVGLDRIRVIRFEDYVSGRRKTVEELCNFLGISPEISDFAEEEVYNKSQGKPVKGPLWTYVQQHPLYRRYLRRLAPPKVRLAFRRAVFPKAKTNLAPPAQETIDLLRAAVASDVHSLQETLQLTAPLWEGF